MFKNFIVVLACFFYALIPFDGLAQSPYRTSWEKEIVFAGGGIVALGTGAYLRDHVTLFTPEELEHMDRYAINELDRLATFELSESVDRASDYLNQTAQLLPVLFLTGKKTRRHFGQIALMYGETMLINGGLTAISKYAIRRPRPFVFNTEIPASAAQTVNAQASFVSGHTSTAAASTFFMAKVFSDFYPDSEWKPVVWTAAAIVPAVTGYFRVRAGKHYPTDVICGYALGAAVGYLVPQLHRRKNETKTDMQLLPTLNGFHYQLRF